jgi:hypothetical protein
MDYLRSVNPAFTSAKHLSDWQKISDVLYMEDCGDFILNEGTCSMPESRERRVWTRYTANRITVNMSEADTEEISWVARMQDLSQKGIGLLFKRRFEVGAKLTVELLVEGRGEPVQLHVQVVHADQKPDGKWYVGCQLAMELSEEELQSLLQSPP